MPEPYGPIRVTGTRQISLPKVLMERMGLKPGDLVYVQQNATDPDALVVLPATRVTERLERGALSPQTQVNAG